MSKVRYTQQLDCGVRLFPGKESLMVFEFVDNTGHRYSARKVKKMIRRQKDKYGWEFLFLGANIDAVEMAGHPGIVPYRAANYL